MLEQPVILEFKKPLTSQQIKWLKITSVPLGRLTFHCGSPNPHNETYGWDASSSHVFDPAGALAASADTLQVTF